MNLYCHCEEREANRRFVHYLKDANISPLGLLCSDEAIQSLAAATMLDCRASFGRSQ